MNHVAVYKEGDNEGFLEQKSRSCPKKDKGNMTKTEDKEREKKRNIDKERERTTKKEEEKEKESFFVFSSRLVLLVNLLSLSRANEITYKLTAIIIVAACPLTELTAFYAKIQDLRKTKSAENIQCCPQIVIDQVC